MCKNLVEKGNLSSPLIVYNRTKKRADDLTASLGSGKAIAVATVAEAVKEADIVFTCVGDDKAIKETIETAIKSDVTGILFVDCSTVHPDTTNELAKLIEAKGAQFVACPVFGAPAMADSGNLICVLAGSTEAVDKVKPYTTGVMGRANIDLSNQPQGKATHLKVLGNTMILNMIESLAEGLTVAEKTGLGADNLHLFIEKMWPGPYEAYSTRMRSGDYHKREEPLFTVDLARKDAGHAMAMAKSAGCRMKDVEVADEHLKQVKEHMGARGDIASIYGAVRKENGLKFEN